MASASLANNQNPMRRRPFGSLCLALLASCLLAHVFAPAAQAQAVPAAEESKYPMPDLKEFEKHFKVVFRYDEVNYRAIMTIVPLVESPSSRFKLLFYDGAGERIDSGYGFLFFSTVVGEPKTCTVTVSKRVLDRAKKAVLSKE
jgi:hypothetical protein